MKFVTLNRYYFETDLDNFITTLIDIDGNKLYFDKTMFYAESGGQESDLGTIKSLNKNIEFNLIHSHNLCHEMTLLAHSFNNNLHRKNVG